MVGFEETMTPPIIDKFALGTMTLEKRGETIIPRLTETMATTMVMIVLEIEMITTATGLVTESMVSTTMMIVRTNINLTSMVMIIDTTILRIMSQVTTTSRGMIKTITGMVSRQIGTWKLATGRLIRIMIMTNKRSQGGRYDQNYNNSTDQNYNNSNDQS